MQMSRLLYEWMIALLAGDPNNLFDPTVDFIKLRLIGNDFALSPSLVKADLELIVDGLTIPGPAAIPEYGLTAQSIDTPGTWEIVKSGQAAYWAFRSDGTNLPLTAYGVALLGHDEDDLWAVYKFPTPVQFLAANQAIILSNVFFTWPESTLVS